MIQFTTYYGHNIWIVATRVLYVEQGTAGSRGISCNVKLDTGVELCLSGRAEDIQKRIAEALGL